MKKFHPHQVAEALLDTPNREEILEMLEEEHHTYLSQTIKQEMQLPPLPPDDSPPLLKK
ncbi:MAG: hypothetical protein WCT39_01600 [Candidatus Margulisiibacteriota bacterium]